MTTPNQGVNVNDGSITSAADSFLARWKDAEELSETEDEDTSNESDEDNLDDQEDDATDLTLDEDDENEEDDSDEDDADADQSDDDDSDELLEADDDLIVTMTVDGETKTASVKELKRLFGQEAALTRKSQEVAALRKKADTDAERYMVATQRLMEKATARFEPFAKIDWMVAQNKLSSDQFAALRAEAKEAYDDLAFLHNESEAVLQQVQETRQAEIAETAKKSIETLERDIPGWNREVYDQVRSFAVESGLAPEVVNQIVEAPALKLMHDAMKYAELKKKAQFKRAKVKKVGAVKKVVKQSSSSGLSKKEGKKGAQQLAALAQTGSRDDAAAAFMSRWEDSDD